MPICILAVFAFVGGWANAAMLEEKWHKFAEYVEPHVAHHEEEAAAGGEGEHAEAAAVTEEQEADPPPRARKRPRRSPSFPR